METVAQLRREIIEFLAQSNEFETENSRRATLLLAGLDHVTQTLDLSGGKRDFVTRLVDYLMRHDTKNEALSKLLNAVANGGNVGVDKQAILADFCDRLRPPTPTKPPEKPAQTQQIRRGGGRS